MLLLSLYFFLMTADRGNNRTKCLERLKTQTQNINEGIYSKCNLFLSLYQNVTNCFGLHYYFINIIPLGLKKVFEHSSR